MERLLLNSSKPKLNLVDWSWDWAWQYWGNHPWTWTCQGIMVSISIVRREMIKLLLYFCSKSITVSIQRPPIPEIRQNVIYCFREISEDIQSVILVCTGWLKKNARILPYHKNCCSLWTLPRNYKPFFSSENWDSYANFEYRTISVLI